MQFTSIFLILFTIFFKNCLALDLRTENNKIKILSVDNEDDRKIIDEKIEKIANKIENINKEIDNINFEAAKNSGLEISMEFLKNIRKERSCYFYLFSEKETDICKTILNITDERTKVLYEKIGLLEKEMDELFVNDKMIELEKEYNDKQNKKDNIVINTVKKAFPKFTENDLEKIKSYKSLPEEERFDEKNKNFLTRKERKYYDLYYSPYSQMNKDGTYDEYKKLSDEMYKIYREKIPEEKKKAKLSFAIEKYNTTGKIPIYYAQSCLAHSIIKNSKRFNESKPLFSLFFDFGKEKFILKDKKFYQIINGKEKLLIDNLELEIETYIFYSAIFDQEKKIIYIYQDIVSEPVDKYDNIITLDLKTKQAYLFYDDFPFFSKFYLYNNQLFATGRQSSSDTTLTYLIKNDRSELINGNNGVKLIYENTGTNNYKVKSASFTDKNVLFLHPLSFNKQKKVNPVKLLDNKTNKIYSLKCGYMYKSYYWAKSYFNALNTCEICGGVFGELRLDYEAFTYDSKDEAKIYSGCDDANKPPVSIDEFCKDIKD